MDTAIDAAVKVSDTAAPETVSSGKIKKNKKRIFFDIVLGLGWLCCLVPGPFPDHVTAASAVLILCIAVSFFDENFYLYAALFIYCRYTMLLGDTPAYRIYSYMIVLRFLLDIRRTKFKMVYFPALFVFFLHSIFAMPALTSLRIGLNVIVDVVLIYIVLLKVSEDANLVRKFIFVFLMGGITSGVYGWTRKDVSVDINVAGAGVHTVNRNFGSLNDSNFAGLFYSLCIICSVVTEKIPVWLKSIFVALFMVMLLQTASLSALLVLSVLLVFYIILKFRVNSVFILLLVFAAIISLIAVIYAVPQLRRLPAISGLIIRITEKLSYLHRGRMDLVTTDRSAIWDNAIRLYMSFPLWRMLIGGKVVTVMAIDFSIVSMACHNSYLQSILNFGVLGALAIYIPLFSVFFFRLNRHFSTPGGYKDEDISMLRLILPFAFMVFGYTVDFFIDWPYVMLYFF